MHHCLKTPSGRACGLRLESDRLGNDFYDALEWADEHFSGHFVKQTDEHVYICADVLKKIDQADREALETEPIPASGIGLSLGDGGAPNSGSGPDNGDDDGAVAEPSGL